VSAGTARRRAAFLDRDGVLNVDHGFVADPADFDWMEGAPEAIRYLNDAGYVTVVVTNQSGIGRGLYAEEAFHRLHRWIDDELRRFGARLDAVYHCPHLPDADVAAYRQVCECRKPKPGMLLDAIRDLDLDPASSFLLGDRQRDLDAAAAAGVAGHLLGDANVLDAVRAIVEAR
jgi:D-glycero-D-manno-heptose 1,7-bisphosphate phosphatase